MCDKLSSPRRVDRFAWNFGGIYNWTRAIALGTFPLPIGTRKPEIGCFSKTGSRKYAWWKENTILNCHILFFYILIREGARDFWKFFAHYVIIYEHTRSKMILAATRIEESKNEGMTLITKLMSFPIDTFRLPITMIGTSGFRKTAYFRFRGSDRKWNSTPCNSPIS